MSTPAPSGNHTEITPAELAAMLKDGAAVLVDVREPDEFAAGHIAGAVNLPLSRFSPDQLPHPAGKRLVLQCAGGKRSGMALDRCAAAGMARAKKTKRAKRARSCFTESASLSS